MKKIYILVGLAALVWPGSVSAHPGHGLDEASWTHLLLSPDHLVVLLAVGAMLCVFGQWVRRRLAGRVLSWGGATLAGVSLLLLVLRF